MCGGSTNLLAAGNGSLPKTATLETRLAEARAQLTTLGDADRVQALVGASSDLGLRRAKPNWTEPTPQPTCCA